jgi:hypothetical protein
MLAALQNMAHINNDITAESRNRGGKKVGFARQQPVNNLDAAFSMWSIERVVGH